MNTKFMMQSTYDAIQNLPIVKFLLEENEKLKKENGALKNLIYSLPEFRSKKSSKKSRVNLYSAERKKEYVRGEGGEGNSNVLYPEYIKANVVNPIKEEKIPIKKEKKVTIKREIINVDEMNANPSDIVVKEEEVTFVQNIICVEDESETEIVDLNLNNSKQLPTHNNKAKEEEAEQDIENTRVKKPENVLEIVEHHEGEEKQKTENLEVKKTEETTSIVKEDDDDDTEEEIEVQEQETVKVEVDKTEEITLAVKEQDEEAADEDEDAEEDDEEVEDAEEEVEEDEDAEEDEDVEEQEDSRNVEVKKTVAMTSAVEEEEEEAEEEEEEEAEEEEEEVNEEAEEEEEEEEEDSTNIEIKKTVEMTSAVKEEAEEAEEEEEECFEIEIDGVSYYTNNETNGKIYNIGADEDDIGDEVGYFKDKKPHFTNK
jgi:hypothetical protein